MNIIFTEDDPMVHERARYLRGGLLRNYHGVTVLKTIGNAPKADAWFHGISGNPAIPFRKEFADAIERFEGPLCIYQNDDARGFLVDKIPRSLVPRVGLFIRNVWPAEEIYIPEPVRNKTGLINPLLKPAVACRGPDLEKRAHGMSFFGATTSCYGRHTRVEALRILRRAGIFFSGGLINSPPNEPPPPDLFVSAIGGREHAKLLSASRISLALHGHNPLTFRFFESLSRRCCVLAQDLDCIRFARCGLKAGVHYVSVCRDLSDLAEKARYYLDHVAEAQRIADAGYKHFKKHFQFSGINLPQPVYEEMAATWRGVVPPRGTLTPLALLRKLLLPVIKRI